MISVLKKRRVLLLDDDPSMQRLVAALLRREGYRVDVVSSGSQAIEKLERADYDALVLDIMTPTEGGMTVIRHLKETTPTLLRRVVLLTASPRAVLKSVESDVAAIVHKPFDAQGLMDTIQRVLTA